MHECLEKFKTTKLSRSHKWHTGLCLPRHNTRFQLLEIQVIVVFLLIALVSVFIIILKGAGMERGLGVELSPFHHFVADISLHTPTLHSFPVLNHVHPLPAPRFCFQLPKITSLRRKIPEFIISPGSTLYKGLFGGMGPRAEGLPFSGFRCIEWKGFHKLRYMWKGREIGHVRHEMNVKYNTWFSG